MKNLLIITLFAILASCTVTKPVISVKSFNDETLAVVDQITSFDTYIFSGKYMNTQNDTISNIINDKRLKSKKIIDSIIHVDTYVFKNINNEIVSYDVSYKLIADVSYIPYIYNIDIINCKTDNVGHFDIICGNNGYVNKIKTIQPDQKNEFYATKETYLNGVGSSLILSMLMYIYVPLLFL